MNNPGLERPVEVVFRDVTLCRGGVEILSSVSFATEGRDFFMIYGPSGSGKTSLLRLVNRLDESDGGEVLVGGASVGSYRPGDLRRRVGMIFQEPRLFGGSVSDNVMLAVNYHGLKRDLEELLASVGLSGAAGRDVQGLSGGEQQRVAIARALAVGPELLLLDEPTSSLDEAATLDIEALLVELAASRGLKTLFVTHDREQLRRLGGEGVLLDRGRVAGLGSIHEMIGRGHV